MGFGEVKSHLSKPPLGNPRTATKIITSTPRSPSININININNSVNCLQLLPRPSKIWRKIHVPSTWKPVPAKIYLTYSLTAVHESKSFSPRSNCQFGDSHLYSDYKDDGTNILLDANENAYGPCLPLNGSPIPQTSSSDSSSSIDFLGLHRYPDPHQHDLKQRLCKLRNTHSHTSKNLTPANLFVGVGSDEAIDALLRCFCVPGRDRILVCPPTYGMYSVSAQVNDVGLVKVPLLPAPEFALDVSTIISTLSSPQAANIKVIYVCSPGNPTASLLRKEDLQKILEHPSWNGVVVLDEAYIDFAPEDSSLAEWVLEWPNLVVMQTLSKAFGLAGIRLGMAFTSEPIASLLNNLKAPYNISSPTSAIATQAVQDAGLAAMEYNRDRIFAQRDRILRELPKIRGVGRFRGGNESNFLLVEMLDVDGNPDNVTALNVYERLAENRGVVVRFRGKEHGCMGCLRITVGTEEEVSRFLNELKIVIRQVHAEASPADGAVEERKEEEASAVIA
ncbi:putative histidinol-phosphate transaminase [Venustampulla echinocandica]|uniref:histidinol-phosphate transaminase n=1 Tax=Venustampulla echinocandica TaxID=2656787 RepID=A0A370TJJ3_9HELO|nr:putative histidinol-phosphate transaminase [Venustampulla echinocandica]RDL35679.1 putative histidinol-phosphate transaminase [Venustampulla echinocandica]